MGQAPLPQTDASVQAPQNPTDVPVPTATASSPAAQSLPDFATKYKDLAWVVTVAFALIYCLGWILRWASSIRLGTDILEQPKEPCIAAAASFLAFSIPIPVSLFVQLAYKRFLYGAVAGIVAVTGILWLFFSRTDIYTVPSPWKGAELRWISFILIGSFIPYYALLRRNPKSILGAHGGVAKVFVAFIALLIMMNEFAGHMLVRLPSWAGGYDFREVFIVTEAEETGGKPIAQNGVLLGQDSKSVALLLWTPPAYELRKESIIMTVLGNRSRQVIPWSRVKTLTLVKSPKNVNRSQPD